MRLAADILTVLAGAIVGALLRRRDAEPGSAWRTEWADLDRRLSSRLAMHDAALAELGGKFEAATAARDLGEMQRRHLALEERLNSAVSEFARQPDLAANYATISGAVEEQERRIAALEQTVDGHDRKWEAADRVAAALAEKVSAAMAEMDRHLTLQEDRIEALNTAAAQTGSMVAQALDSVQALSSRVASQRTEPLRVRATETTALASLIADEAGVGKLRHIRL